MSKDKVITVMCAARLPELLVRRIDSAAASGGVSRAQFIAEACRMRLEAGSMAPVLGVNNLLDQAAERAPSGAVSVRLQDSYGNVIGERPVPAKPDIAALQAICAGEVAKNPDFPQPAYFGGGSVHPSDTLSAMGAIGHGSGLFDLCPHREWAEDGEQYRCRLMAGHKGKCVPGERVS